MMARSFKPLKDNGQAKKTRQPPSAFRLPRRIRRASRDVAGNERQSLPVNPFRWTERQSFFGDLQVGPISATNGIQPQEDMQMVIHDRKAADVAGEDSRQFPQVVFNPLLAMFFPFATEKCAHRERQ